MIRQKELIEAYRLQAQKAELERSIREIDKALRPLKERVLKGERVTKGPYQVTVRDGPRRPAYKNELIKASSDDYVLSIVENTEPSKIVKVIHVV